MEYGGINRWYRNSGINRRKKDLCCKWRMEKIEPESLIKEVNQWFLL